MGARGKCMVTLALCLVTLWPMEFVCDGLEFKPHLGGHGDKAHYNRGVLYGTKALTSNRMLPHCGYEGLSTLGLKQ